MTTDTLQSTRNDSSRERYDINRGLLNGCSLYLSDRDRFSVRSGTFNKEIHEQFTSFAKNAGVFVDIGAAEGLYSVYMLKNSTAKVYSYEPACDDLLRNLEANTRDGHRLQFGADRISAEQQPDSQTVDSIVAHERGPIFLKVDSEGNEADVLRGAGRVLDREDTKLIIRVSSKTAEKECMWILDEFAFDVSIIGPAWWRAIVKDRSPENPNRWIIASKSELDGLFS